MTLDPGYWAFQCAAMLLTCFVIPKLTVDGPIPAFFTVLALAFINSHIWSTALFMQVPDSLTNKVILLFLTNGALFWLVVKVLPGISVEGVFPALIAPVVFSLMSLLIDKYEKDIDWAALWNMALEYINAAKNYFSSIKNTQSFNSSPWSDGLPEQSTPSRFFSARIHFSA